MFKIHELIRPRRLGLLIILSEFCRGKEAVALVSPIVNSTPSAINYLCKM